MGLLSVLLLTARCAKALPHVVQMERLTLGLTTSAAIDEGRERLFYQTRRSRTSMP